MDALKIFENPIFGSVRISMDASNQPLFCASDVCKALGYAKPQNAVAMHVDKGDALKQGTPIPNQYGTIVNQQLTYVNESGLYALIFGSKQERAKEFKRWVTSEVLPAIRQDGGYMVDKANESEEDLMARALSVAQKVLKRREERIKLLEKEANNKNKQIQQQTKAIEIQTAQIKELNSAVGEMQPKVSYVDMVLQCKETVTTTKIAQDYGKSAKAFNVLLRNNNIQHKVNGQWILYSKYLSRGYVQSDTISIMHSNGMPGTVMHTKWTQKGRLFLYEELKKKGVLPLIESSLYTQK